MDLIKNTAMLQLIKKKKKAYHLVGFNLTTSEFWGACSTACYSHDPFFLSDWVSISIAYYLITSLPTFYPLALTVPRPVSYFKVSGLLYIDLGKSCFLQKPTVLSAFHDSTSIIYCGRFYFFTKNKIKNKRAWFRFFDILSNDFLFLFFCCDEKKQLETFFHFLVPIWTEGSMLEQKFLPMLSRFSQTGVGN